MPQVPRHVVANQNTAPKSAKTSKASPLKKAQGKGKRYAYK